MQQSSPIELSSHSWPLQESLLISSARESSERAANRCRETSLEDSHVPKSTKIEDLHASYKGYSPSSVISDQLDPNSGNFRDSLRSPSLARPSIHFKDQIKSLRDIVFITRQHVRAEKIRCGQQEDLLISTMDRFIDLSKSCTLSGFSTQMAESLNLLSQNLRATKDELTLRRQRATALEDILYVQESQLYRFDEDVYRDSGEENSRRNESLVECQLPPDSVYTTMPTCATPDERTSLRNELYSCMGDLRIHLERLNTFEHYLQHELGERELLRAADGAEMSSDADFFEERRAEQSQIQKDLDMARVSVERLKKKCHEQGIDFEEPILPKQLYRIDIKSPSTSSEQSIGCNQVQPSSSRIINTFFSAQERVRNWLKEPTGSIKLYQDEVQLDSQSRLEPESATESWIAVRSGPSTRRPSETRSLDRLGSVTHTVPEWTTGPLPGSSQLEALLLESTSTPLGKYVHQHGTESVY
ncbi:hypothetical protein P153DRAFT_392071 [Dothidotthia symphoricarpi CBS 119687]|uniref:Uncharacterized protein n=1 Tax=Dothidotthia symphoricarpi CBS 119687 TaxID=1392245 RepID=A0A6A6AUY0_9PLEO|nr:uncharacterized protein P153DRAFT_392071 [Dothidotthia symphoricarpi CBS 119687]KAF2134754.1 hypothetical protein P153DRAFT_392071 [Dothidotthia symphoricarpi CBS 119687]